MQARVCVALALLVMALPGKQVLAQTAPHDLAQAQATQIVPHESSVEAGASAPAPPELLLWRPFIENRKAAMERQPAVETPRERAWSDWSTEKKVLVVGGGVLALVILGIVSIG